MTRLHKVDIYNVFTKKCNVGNGWMCANSKGNDLTIGQHSVWAPGTLTARPGVDSVSKSFTLLVTSTFFHLSWCIMIYFLKNCPWCLIRSSTTIWPNLALCREAMGSLSGDRNRVGPNTIARFSVLIKFFWLTWVTLRKYETSYCKFITNLTMHNVVKSHPPQFASLVC